MTANYVKTAWRSLRRNRLFSLLNVAGLATGMAVSFTLLLYVIFQFSYNRFHRHYPHLYQVKTGKEGGSGLPIPLAAELKSTVPEIKAVARTAYLMPRLLQAGKKSVKLSGFFTDPSFLDMFSFPLVEGTGALGERNAIVLTEGTARKLFGAGNALGRMVMLDATEPLVVTGVVKDPPPNSTLQFAYLLSWRLFEKEDWVRNPGWGPFVTDTYVQLEPAASEAAAGARIRNILQRHLDVSPDIYLVLHAMSRWKLYGKIQDGNITGGEIEAVRLFGVLALAILLIACVNFMNLSTAQSGQRAKEVGVRKAIGAGRAALVKQFLTEALLLAAAALLLALLMMWAALPLFNRLLVQEGLSLRQAPAAFWVFAAVLTLLTGLLSGSYPAFFLSSFKAVQTLKGKPGAGKGAFLPRQALVVLQFSAAVALIIITIIVYQQVSFIKNKPLGYELKGLVDMPLEGRIYNDFEPFIQQAVAEGAITDACITNSSLANGDAATWGLSWPGQQAGEEKMPFRIMAAMGHLVSTFGMQLKEGRDFRGPADSMSIMLNEAAVKAMRLKDPIGQQIVLNGAKRTITGVLKDFVWLKSYVPVAPAIFPYNPEWRGLVTMKLNPALGTAESLRRLERVFHRFNPDYPFEYNFVDEVYARNYAYEQLLSTLVNVFAALSILISCLGLLGLSVYAAEQRKKEIGIRRVMGAGVRQVTLLLSANFMKPVLVGILLATPVAWYVTDKWLQRYAYHITVQWWMFVAGALLAAAVAFLTVSCQSFRAALMNPVASLKAE